MRSADFGSMKFGEEMNPFTLRGLFSNSTGISPSEKRLPKMLLMAESMFEFPDVEKMFRSSHARVKLISGWLRAMREVMSTMERFSDWSVPRCFKRAGKL